MQNESVYLIDNLGSKSPMAVSLTVSTKMETGSAMSPVISTATVMLPPPSETVYGVLINSMVTAVQTQNTTNLSTFASLPYSGFIL